MSPWKNSRVKVIGLGSGVRSPSVTIRRCVLGLLAFVMIDDLPPEWVVPMRLQHVLQRIPEPYIIQRTGEVIEAMVEDVTREASGEILDNPGVRKAIGSKTVKLYKAYLESLIHDRS